MKEQNDQNEQWISIFQDIMEEPTAPFHEYHVAERIDELLSCLPHVTLEVDDFGNRIALYQRGEQSPQLAFGAHMDHPGWVTAPTLSESNRSSEEDVPRDDCSRDGMNFLGGVPKERLDKADIESFGDFGMWKLSPFELRGDQIHSRACDDLVGCSAIVAMMEELESLQLEASVYGIFTRAEEVGFVGAQELAKRWHLPDGVCFVSVETSSPRGGAEMGMGPVIRVGDRMSVFHDDVTALLVAAASAAGVDHQRALLDGGSCEATVMNLHGIPAAGISVMLGNYHNCSPDGGIAEEFVSLHDAQCLVRLLVAATHYASTRKAEDTPRERLKARIEARINETLAYREAADHSWPS